MRGIFLKFVDIDFELLFDLMMYIGEEVVFWNIYSFDKMLIVLVGGFKVFKVFCFEDFWK